MAGTGGRRPGAGRKPKAEKYQTAIAKAEKRIADRLPELIDNLFALADGVTVQEMLPDGSTNVYTRPPDFKANAYLIDRIMGKPTERREIEDVTPQQQIDWSTVPADLRDAFIEGKIGYDDLLRALAAQRA